MSTNVNVTPEIALDCSMPLTLAWQRSAKRVVDFAGATIGLLVLGPLMLLIAVLVRLDSRGPSLFHQERAGIGGRPFWVLKFRTMTTDAEARLRDIEALNESEGGGLFKIKQDPRVTRLGMFLRRTSLDELPQLFNVLRGEMSLVGPRPLPLRDCQLLLEKEPQGYLKRLQVLPGVTGPWQVGGRSAVGFREMLRMDGDYIDHWSLWSDLRIIWQTVGVVLLNKGAY